MTKKKGQTMIYKALHRKWETAQNWRWTPEGLVVTPVMLLLNNTNIIWNGHYVTHQYT